MTRLTQLPLPPYSYVPGLSPHPRSHVNGHSYGVPEPHVSSFDPVHWHACQAYAFGFDLFNQAYYWEAHEQWEAVWLSLGRQGTVADLLKGLIKLAAIGVKAKEGNVVGFQRHQDRASQLFKTVREQHRRLAGLDLDELINVAETLDFDEAASNNRLPLQVVPTP